MAPPIFINGPLLGYRLVLEPVNHPGLHPAMREVQANVMSWTFRQLQPSQYYRLSVSASNREGEGRADTANVTTPNTGNLTAEEMPYLILAEKNKVLGQNMKDLFTQPYPLETIRASNTVVRGIGVHVGRQLLLVSDSSGLVRLVNVLRRNSAVVTCSGMTRPGAVTIDWLNNMAYIVDGNHICQCDFDGNKVTKVTGPLTTSPHDIKVDPINGYLYFTQGSPNTGIYRIDLGSIRPDNSVPFQQVVKAHLRTFSVDYNNLQLYFPDEIQNTMMSSFLDGTGQINLRNSKVVNPNYYGIISMVYYDGLFYWTNGSGVFKEDYDMSNGIFYHNSLLFFGHHYLALNTYQHSIQPKPVPHSPPQSVQALFTADKVYIQWRPPKTLSFQGRGAWKKWEYDVLILENDGSQNQVIQRVMVNEVEISNLEHDTSYMVKVRARSDNKVGPWSNPFVGRTLSTDATIASVVVPEGGFMTTLSEVDMYGDINLRSLTRKQGAEDINMAVVAGIPAAILVPIVTMIMVVWCVIRKRKDIELATLRELPHTVVQQSNTLYPVNFIMPTDTDIATLPHFMREQLTLNKFLGSGAFGDVFEGVARSIISDSSGETKVAVKTLRKSFEKEKFLKEAFRMSNLKHQHILNLLGVCLESHTQFIILELMEGGDLLSFLRGHRPSQTNPVYLSMADLIKICVHVARGCKYLEEMHFVHRDLAARNCLVSSKNPAEFCVKIGDFGLARDIKKKDYYRKEGEGLLPVRWMSPESLVDGVFTTQSDIWAFGVLMWEVITFGQQPYHARTNIEVLNFVQSGGQLDKPNSCPQELFFLMKKCWSFNTEDRPSFSLILHILEEFHQKCIALLSEYIPPIRSSTIKGLEVDGCDRELAVKQRTSSLGHDSSNASRHCDPEALYANVRCVTTFDTTEPRTERFNGYLRPQTAGAPTYLDLISDPSNAPPPPFTKLKPSTNNRTTENNHKYSVKESSKRQSNKNKGALAQDGYMHMETPSQHQLLETSTSYDVKVSQICWYNTCNESKDDVTSENSNYILYNPSSLQLLSKSQSFRAIAQKCTSDKAITV